MSRSRDGGPELADGGSALAVESGSRLAVERVAEQLAACVGTDEVRDIRDKAAAVLVYQRRRLTGQSMALDAGEIVVRAERRLGELLRDAPKSKGGGDQKSAARITGSRVAPVIHTLADQGLSKKESARSQALAAVPTALFEATLLKERARGKAPTPATMIRAVQPQRPREEEDEWNSQVAALVVYNQIKDAYNAWPDGEPMDSLRAILMQWTSEIRKRDDA